MQEIRQSLTVSSRSAIAAFLVTCVLAASASAVDPPQPMVGEVRLMAHPAAPKGWMECDGQKLDIRTNQVLFALIGTAFGGDGRNDFALPKLPPVKSGDVELRYYIAVTGLYPTKQ